MITNEHIMKETLTIINRVYPESENFDSIKVRLSEKYAPQEIVWKSIIAELEERNWIERTKWPFIKITPEGKDALRRMLKEQKQGHR